MLRNACLTPFVLYTFAFVIIFFPHCWAQPTQRRKKMVPDGVAMYKALNVPRRVPETSLSLFVGPYIEPTWQVTHISTCQPQQVAIEMQLFLVWQPKLAQFLQRYWRTRALKTIQYLGDAKAYQTSEIPVGFPVRHKISELDIRSFNSPLTNFDVLSSLGASDHPDNVWVLSQISVLFSWSTSA